MLGLKIAVLALQHMNGTKQNIVKQERHGILLSWLNQ